MQTSDSRSRSVLVGSCEGFFPRVGVCVRVCIIEEASLPEMAPVRAQPLRPVRAMALVLVFASLLATSHTADEAVTDFETRCQNVQCNVDCPTDSYLQNTMDAQSYAKDETSERAKRAIATNNHAHGPISIVPMKLPFQYPIDV